MKSIYFGILLAGLAALSGCGKSVEQGDTGATGATGPQGPAGPVTTASPAPSPESAVQAMVDTENAYRVSVGQEQLIPGLACTAYSVPTTTTAIVGATGLVSQGSFVFTGVFNQPEAATSAGLNIFPAGLEKVLQNWYIVKCTGSFVVSDDNYHEFDVASDDGSNLYIDGLLINNDGLHASVDKSASKYLKYGFHSFELDYFQGQGSEQLILSEDGAVMASTDTEAFYH